MAYAALSDVQGLMAKFLLDTGSTPNSTQVGVLITDVSAEIDSTLAARGITVPVTTPSWFLNALKLLNAVGAAALALRSMFPQQRPGTESGVSEYAMYQEWYKRGLEQIQEGSNLPDGLAGSHAGVAPSTYFTNNPDTDVDLGDIAEPFFTRAKVF